MSPRKESCRYLPCCCKKCRAGSERPDWEMHPSWSAGIEALERYQCWVEEVVLPIAFQWIEEHKQEVYASVPGEFYDDVGVVIAAAFALVKELPPYIEGREKCKSYEAALKAGTLDSSRLNPVWTAITQRIRASTGEAFAEHSAHLGDTAP